MRAFGIRLSLEKDDLETGVLTLSASKPEMEDAAKKDQAAYDRQVLLEEYKTTRAEIAFRLSARTQLIGVAIPIIGVCAALGFTAIDKKFIAAVYPYLILVASWIAQSLVSIAASHSDSIYRLVTFENRVIRPAMAAHAPKIGSRPSWDEWRHSRESGKATWLGHYRAGLAVPAALPLLAIARHEMVARGFFKTSGSGGVETMLAPMTPLLFGATVLTLVSAITLTINVLARRRRILRLWNESLESVRASRSLEERSAVEALI